MTNPLKNAIRKKLATDFLSIWTWIIPIKSFRFLIKKDNPSKANIKKNKPLTTPIIPVD